MIPKRVTNYLDSRGVKYEKVPHKQVFTTFDLANTLKEKMSKIAKTLLIKADKRYVLVVLPAHYRLDMAKLKIAFSAFNKAFSKYGSTLCKPANGVSAPGLTFSIFSMAFSGANSITLAFKTFLSLAISRR